MDAQDYFALRCIPPNCHAAHTPPSYNHPRLPLDRGATILNSRGGYAQGQARLSQIPTVSTDPILCSTHAVLSITAVRT
jgi:hypothetical protein